LLRTIARSIILLEGGSIKDWTHEN
jgi:hypothetical protein